MLFPDAPTLERLADVRLAVGGVLDVGAAPYGRRAVLIIEGGTFEGPAMRGRIRPGGGQWGLRRADGALDLDVRATMEFDDGALAYVSFGGLIVADPATFARAATGEDVAATDYYLRAIARFETGDERHAWLNGVVGAGSGYVGAGVLALRVFAVR